MLYWFIVSLNPHPKILIPYVRLELPRGLQAIAFFFKWLHGVIQSVVEARGKFGEHERNVIVGRGVDACRLRYKISKCIVTRPFVL